MIEAEKQVFLTDEQYKSLLVKFGVQTMQPTRQITRYYNIKDNPENIDLRLIKTAEHMKLWMGRGKIHDVYNEESEVPINLEYFGDMSKILELLFEVKSKMQSEQQITIYYSTKDKKSNYLDLRLMRTVEDAKLWMKPGDIHDMFHDEFTVFIDLKYFDEMNKMLDSILEFKTKWYRERIEIKFKIQNYDAAVCIDRSINYGAIFEVEMLASSDEEKNKYDELLNAYLQELGLEETKKKIKKEKYDNYVSNWRKWEFPTDAIQWLHSGSDAKCCIDDVSFEILSKCPNNCLHCSSRSSMESQDIFSLYEIQNIIEQLAKLSVKRICLSGGEPFLHPDLLAIVGIIVKNGIKCDIYSAGIIENDSETFAIPKDMLTKLKQIGLNRIMFNLQAIDEDKYNLIMGTKGQQQYLFTSIQDSVKSGIETEIHFVPMTHNIDQIDKILTYADDKNIKQVSFLKLVGHGRAKNNGLELNIQEEISVRQKLMKLAELNPRIRIGIPLSYGKVICECHAVNNKIYIKYDGSVYGCEAFKFISLDGINAPNIHDDSIGPIILNSEYFKKSKELICKFKKGENNCPVQNFIRKGEVSNG